MDDHYQTIASETSFRQKIERSEFLAIAFSARDDEAFFARLSGIEKQTFDATHHCWAFRLRHRERSSDAGEPAGTAGAPILGAIDASGLREVGVVVVRWYGGVKLGTGGLGRAYRDTARQALDAAPRADRYDYRRFRVSVPFDAFGVAYRLVDPPHVVLAAEEFGEVPLFDFDVRASRAASFAGALTERQLRWVEGVRIEN